MTVAMVFEGNSLLQGYLYNPFGWILQRPRPLTEVHDRSQAQNSVVGGVCSINVSFGAS